MLYDRFDSVQPDTGIVLLPDARFESDPWFTNQRCVQCALGNPTHNSAMVTEGMKTSALWQQINGSLSPRISRTLNKIWHNSIILKQALSEHTLSREMQERKVLRRTASQVCWKFWLSLSTFRILFWLFTWIRFELACVWKAHRATLYVTVSVCLKRGSYVVLVQFRKTSWDRQLLNQVLHTHFHTLSHMHLHISALGVPA